MTNETKRNLAAVSLSIAVVLMAAVAHIQMDRRAFITKTTQDVTLEVKPIEEPSTLVLLDEVVITAEDEKPSVGAAMVRKPVRIEKSSKSSKNCRLHKLEQGGSPDHPFVMRCEGL